MDQGEGRTLLFWLAVCSVCLITGEALPFLANEGLPSYASKVVSEAADTIVQRVGWNKDAVKISAVDMKDAKLGETVMYEFDIEIGGVVLPIILREEIADWRFLEEDVEGKNERQSSAGEAINMWQPEYVSATLKPFQLAGPVDLWIQDADKLRLAMPNDVEAGVLKRVLVADGAVVTVEGAREVSLTRPLKLPLPLLGGAANDGLASTLLNLASRLRLASRSQDKPLLSMRIVGPSTLVAAASEHYENSAQAGLKVKRLAPGAVELVSRNEIVPLEATNNPSGLTLPWLWPLASLNGSNTDLVVLERALVAFLGPKAYKQGSVTLLKAKASVTSFVKIAFQLEMQLGNESSNFEQWPGWATELPVKRTQFELLAKVEGDQLRAVSVNEVESGSYPTVTSSWGEMTGNQTMGVYTPYLGTVDPMTLDLDWQGIA